MAATLDRRYRQEVPALNKMYQEYKDRAEFFVVYIREAHPSDFWQLSDNIKDKVVFASPKSYEEKVKIGEMCVRNLGIEFPALIDNFEGSTEKVYAGWPDRLYVVDRSGRIAYKSAPGPFGFKPGEMHVALKQAVAAE